MILASVGPLQLLVGKVTGIGVLALAQAALMVAVFLGLGVAVVSSLVHGAAPGIVITGAVFLVLEAYPKFSLKKYSPTAAR